MITFKKFLTIYVCCIIFQGSYGRKLYNSIPYHGSSYPLDETKLVEKKVQYPKSSLSDGGSQTSHLFKINSEMPEEFRQKLPPNESNDHSASNLDSTTYKTLEVQVGEHLIKVKSEKVSKSLGSAPSGGGYDISVNPKFSHVIEIIRRGDNPEKEEKLSQIHDTTVEKQASQLTKTPDSEKIKESEDTDNPEEYDVLDSEEFSEVNEEDSEEFDEPDEEDPGEFDQTDGDDESDEGDTEELGEANPEEFGEADQEDLGEFDEPDEEYPEEFDQTDGDDESDEGDTEELGEANSEEFGEADQEDLGESDESDEEYPEEFDQTDDENVESDERDTEELSEDDPEKFGEADEEDPEEIGEADEENSEELLPDDIQNTTEFFEETKNRTGNEQIADNNGEGTFNDQFEGSGEESFAESDQNTTKTGRILGMFSRQNETFPTCTTPKGEAGHCRRLGECLLSEALNNFNGFLQQLCLIRGALVGICCPDNPVIETVNPDQNTTTELKSEEIKQPPEGCGLNTKTRIVGGTISVPHEWTWMVALLRRNRFYCGGVIINNWYILTAAHCVMGMNVKDLTVRLGEYDFNEQSKHTEDLSVSEIKRHAQFVTLTFQHDIALLKLKRSIKYSKYVGSICLPDQKARDYSDANGTVVGWGTVSFGGAASPVLRQVTVPVWKNEDCDRTYLLERIGDSFMCAGSPEKGEDACQGDSGGPLMTVDENGRWEVIGLVSWGRRCGDPTYPGVYTRVTTYLDWIKQNAV